MRTAPVKCNFTALLDKDAPATCGDGFSEDVLWSEDFEDGLTGWATSSEVVFSGGFNMPWEVSDSAPAGTGAAHPSKVAYGPAPDEGQCSNGAGDFSSRDSITGPVVQMPDSLRSAKLTFEHYVATEIGYDGAAIGDIELSTYYNDPLSLDVMTAIQQYLADVEAGWQSGPMGTLRLMRAALPHLREGGAVVNVSSSATSLVL